MTLNADSLFRGRAVAAELVPLVRPTALAALAAPKAVLKNVLLGELRSLSAKSFWVLRVGVSWFMGD